MQTSPAPRRVGMFGGAFDPPHKAHRELAETAIAQLGLDVLHVLPTGLAWHKTRVLTPAADRLAMCRLAFGDLPQVHIDDREIRREGPSYTADTLIELRAQYPQARLFLVLGADQLKAFRSWVRWQEIPTLATLAVAGRPIAGDATDLEGVGIPHEALHMPLRDISATDVRARIRQPEPGGQPLDVLVPEGVARYISQHRLYLTPQ
ncbi:nicotinate (nicotinamide) nucleotide adenylyltransferase [Hydrogenophaga sp.]|uniref:nicotinate (nicotinamide) nucleotide adenylyltransferase n=1 Tax=Hydrogenophaga sp. TaxID=1904254 RepID=UPI00263A2C97|nr:nicotinate (nicotinamide) nucleotide adenylyltransferase [Hydrogenophaga sp.]MCW5652340.1 nicotinate (nicotinamide) nucleotide adenylyltransferase [Hydrogenophaga sp.]